MNDYKSKFAAKYLHPLWQKKRLEIMNRDEFACMDCGEQEQTLNVHHAYYIKNREPWQYPSFALKTLCKSCHMATHFDELEEGEEWGLDQWEQAMDWMCNGDPEIASALWDVGVEMAQAIDRGATPRAAIIAMMDALMNLKREVAA